MLRTLLVLFAFLVLAAAGLVLMGAQRYGGLEGLSFRVRAEVAARFPEDHPLTVPTPLGVEGSELKVEGCTLKVDGCVGTPDAGLMATAAAFAGTATERPQANRTAQPAATATSTSRPAPSATPTPPATPRPATTAGPTDSPRASLTAGPTDTPTGSATASPTPVVVKPAAPAAALSELSHAWQTWNNCGPATLAMHLSYFGSKLTQEQVRQVLRPNRDDKNVSMDELAAFARSQGLQAAVLVNGDAGRLRLLLSNGLPVLVETWLEPKPNDGMGHYRLLTGYDTSRREWLAYDSYIATGGSRDGAYQPLRLPDGELASLWRVFNRTYLVLYTADQAPLVAAILGDDIDPQTMWQASLDHAEGEIGNAPQDAFAWFNRGSALVALGRYEEAAAAYDQARVLGLPWRMLWYQFGPFQAYSEVGRYQEVVALADATLRTTGSIEELHYWRGRGLQGLGQTEAAAESYRRAVAFNPGYRPAAEALAAFGAK